MTRGAAANAILDAGRSKKRLSPSPHPPTHPPPAPSPSRPHRPHPSPVWYTLSVFLRRSSSASYVDSFLLRSFALHAFARAHPPLPSVFSSFLFPCLSRSRSPSLFSFSASFFCLLLPFPRSLYPERCSAFPPALFPCISFSLPLFLSFSLSLRRIPRRFTPHRCPSPLLLLD
jgi:hypothetical protein